MSRSKKMFLGVALVFLVIMGAVGYDISQRTTFPGSKGQLKERITKAVTEEEGGALADSTQGVDSLPLATQ